MAKPNKGFSIFGSWPCGPNQKERRQRQLPEISGFIFFYNEKMKCLALLYTSTQSSNLK
jgi:hypothetical protein